MTVSGGMMCRRSSEFGPLVKVSMLRFTMQRVSVVLAFLSVPEGLADWKGLDDANAVFAMARTGNRLFCGMRNGDIRSWKLSSPYEPGPNSERVDPSAEANAADGVQGGTFGIFRCFTMPYT